MALWVLSLPHSECVIKTSQKKDGSPGPAGVVRLPFSPGHSSFLSGGQVLWAASSQAALPAAIPWVALGPRAEAGVSLFQLCPPFVPIREGEGPWEVDRPLGWSKSLQELVDR